ncbi:hypothetical protein L873DRAFT_819874 [Choiromyces venosus 120613-1]|uniref:Uncharacterized protein n=1 Tax=Choiromyces venosus 120613-1 TaxID=1336337 RepID=A0A3N4IRP0_9PEZI|nr:hypothetical protein L873DRAFT_819874 [Choiromyces venosus 120613-1]
MLEMHSRENVVTLGLVLSYHRRKCFSIGVCSVGFGTAILADGEIALPTDKLFVSLRDQVNYSPRCCSDSVLHFLYISFLSSFVS